MTTNPHNPDQALVKAASYKEIDAAIHSLAVIGQEGVLPGEETPEEPGERFAKLIARLLKIYEGIKPLLTTIATLSLIPSAWRAGIALFINALQSVADMEGGDFKAGKDL